VIRAQGNVFYTRGLEAERVRVNGVPPWAPAANRAHAGFEIMVVDVGAHTVYTFLLHHAEAIVRRHEALGSLSEHGIEQHDDDNRREDFQAFMP
jgi:hypothetical protein